MLLNKNTKISVNYHNKYFNSHLQTRRSSLMWLILAGSGWTTVSCKSVPHVCIQRMKLTEQLHGIHGGKRKLQKACPSHTGTFKASAHVTSIYILLAKAPWLSPTSVHWGWGRLGWVHSICISYYCCVINDPKTHCCKIIQIYDFLQVCKLIGVALLT